MPYVFESGSLLEDGCQSPGQSNEQSKMKEDNEKETKSVEERIDSLDMLISGKWIIVFFICTYGKLGGVICVEELYVELYV